MSSEIDLKLTSEKFAACLMENGQISVQKYIEAYTELCRFFDVLGTIFGFILSDVRSKLDILSAHVSSQFGDNYTSVESMTQYEMENNLTREKINGHLNGSRTLLRLHRALKFIILFLEKVEKADDNDKLPALAVDAYNTTLKNYHPWLIQKAAILAMQTLGTRQTLLESVNKYDREESLQYLKELVHNGNNVYQKVQNIYEEKKLLDLP